MDTTVRYTASDDLRSGVELQGGRYRIISTLGRGGFGITYLAEQVNVRRKVCIKEFFPKAYYRRDGDSGAITLSSDGFAELMSKFKDKFIKEAYTIAELDHPNIIRIHDVFEENSTAYYVMEYIDGESLQSKVNSSGAMAESAAHEYIKQVAAALDHVHSQQIMHLDVKPGNVMVRAKDNRAILIDFGLSKHYDAESGDATSTTIVGVSHGYAPMEQYKEGGISSFSPSTDIYSLGATLYFLVVGKTPPSADVVGEDGIGVLPSGLSRGTRSAIERAMQHRRKDRPQSIADFLALLSGKGKPVAPKPTDPKTRSKWWLWLLLLLLIAAGGYVGYMMSGGDNPESTPEPTSTSSTGGENVVNADSICEVQPQAARPAPTFTLAKSSLTVDSSGGSHSVGYTIEHPIDGESVSVSDNQQWITNLSASGGNITFKTTDNTYTEPCTGTITATYNGITRQITVTQKGADHININGHYAVDLGLSVKWATCNVGATSPEDYGNYYAWGETTTKTSYDEDNYQHWVDYNGDGHLDDGEFTINTDISGTRYDAARANWGGSWRLPTKSEFDELIDKCTWTWTKLNGVDGYEVKSKKNGNSIFLPAAGNCSGDTPHYQGSYGFYWSSTTNDTYSACNLSFFSGRHYTSRYDRYLGQSVRPVAE